MGPQDLLHVDLTQSLSQSESSVWCTRPPGLTRSCKGSTETPVSTRSHWTCLWSLSHPGASTRPHLTVETCAVYGPGTGPTPAYSATDSPRVLLHRPSKKPRPLPKLVEDVPVQMTRERLARQDPLNFGAPVPTVRASDRKDEDPGPFHRRQKTILRPVCTGMGPRVRVWSGTFDGALRPVPHGARPYHVLRDLRHVRGPRPRPRTPKGYPTYVDLFREPPQPGSRPCRSGVGRRGSWDREEGTGECRYR